MSEFPEWVRKQRAKGTEIREQHGSFYLYKITSVWDRKKGRARKITERYLGKITPDGIVKPKSERVLDELEDVTVKEYGATAFILSVCSDLFELLRKHFPEEWREIAVFSVTRLFHQSPLKNAMHHYMASHLSDAIPGANVSPRSISEVLSTIGLRRQRVVDFMRNFVTGSQAVIDLSHVFSMSEGIVAATLGHNEENSYVPQLNIVLLLALGKKHHPSFFRMVPGSIGDISTVPATLKEAGVRKAVLIGDKAFYSKRNILFLEGRALQYILPLKRDSRLIDYTAPSSADRRAYDGQFLFEGRVIWHHEHVVEGRRIILFFDEKLKTEEGKDLIQRMHGRRKRMRDYYSRQYSMGTIAVITNTALGARSVFELLKHRVDIEQSFDTFKNTLHADRSYMRDDMHMQGWMLANFVAMLLYYRIYNMLAGKDMLGRYSAADIIMHLSRIYKLKIEDRWMLSEIPKTSRDVAEELGFKPPIP
jgi:hypothetical protein